MNHDHDRVQDPDEDDVIVDGLIVTPDHVSDILSRVYGELTINH